MGGGPELIRRSGTFTSQPQKKKEKKKKQGPKLQEASGNPSLERSTEN